MIIFDFDKCEIINFEIAHCANGIEKIVNLQEFTIKVNYLKYYEYLNNWIKTIRESGVKQEKRELFIANSYNDLLCNDKRFNLLGCFISQIEITVDNIDIEVTIRYDYSYQNDKELKQLLRDIKINQILK